ncbi:hypothetical protein RV134_230095 [Roseovarius sp. EC-HK134]|nr:hypothetical protein RV134_230095 [Roseovarius sp. EC-HK134]VVT03312.1 hypothetical protein RV420_270095 [Roseovarius sp. EC-SD190]
MLSSRLPPSRDTDADLYNAIRSPIENI